GINKAKDNDGKEDQRTQKRKPDLLEQVKIFVWKIDDHEVVVAQQIAGKELYLNATASQFRGLGQRTYRNQRVELINDPQVEALGNSPIGQLALHFSFYQTCIKTR